MQHQCADCTRECAVSEPQELPRPHPVGRGVPSFHWRNRLIEPSPYCLDAAGRYFVYIISLTVAEAEKLQGFVRGMWPHEPPAAYSCSACLQNRAKCQLALQAGKFYTSVDRVCVWGNHSTTQVPGPGRFRDFCNVQELPACAPEAVGWMLSSIGTY